MFDLLTQVPTDVASLLLLGLGLGLLHSLDADHVMAVSVLNNQRPSLRRTLSFALYWALGHGGVLLCGGLLLFGLGVSIPERFSFVAEVGVALLLIGLGVYLVYQLLTRRMRIAEHRHGDIVHTHWHNDDHINAPLPKGDVAPIHQPMMVGLLHGLAGSAPALALIPAMGVGDVSVAMAYLVLFSLGVIASMLAFGLGFTSLQTLLYRRYQIMFQCLRGVLAIGAITAGSALLLRTL